MKTLLHRWRGLQLAAAIAATVFAAQGAPEVQTLGGGPNQSGPGRAGANNGDTFTVAKFNDPWAVAIDNSGDLYIADRANNKIRKVTNPSTGASLTTTFASRLPSPVGVAVDASNHVYVVTKGDGKLRVFDSSGSLLRTVAGLRKPSGVVLGAGGNVYVLELVGNVKQIAPDNSVTLIASGFRQPQGIALLANGLLAVSDTGHNAIYTVNPADGTTTLVAGNNGAGSTDGSGAQAQFRKPSGIGAAPNGSLVIADRGNHRVRVLSPSNEVTTLFGVPRSKWVAPFSGWADGEGGLNGSAATHDPVGVAVGADGTVYVTEIYWNLLRAATGTGLTGGNTGISTNVVVIGTNTVTVVGTNIISFGFQNGEASSDFVGAAGQHFYAPVTLTIAPGQPIYTFQMGLAATNDSGGVALNPFEAAFVSMVEQPSGLIEYTNPLTGVITRLNAGYVPIEPNYLFLNSSIDLLGVGWLERYTQTNLYNTLAQDLIAYSIAKDTLFLSSGGKVVLGAYRVPIPSSATDGDSFRIAIKNASGTSDGISQPVPLRIPTDGSLGAGALNSVKRVTLASRTYVVGDSAPFRWFNAGDFGNQVLANDDVMEVFETAVYSLNFHAALRDSDLFDAMDSSSGATNTLFSGDDSLIDTVTTGDSKLAVDDVFVTFRRSLDPTLKWFGRYWSNGVRQVVEVPNPSGPVFSPTVAAAPQALLTGEAHPKLSVQAGDAMANADATVQIPVRVHIDGQYPLRVMMLNVTVEALDGSPAIVDPIQFQIVPGFGTPVLTESRSPNNFAAAWLSNRVTGVSGDATLAFISVRVPAVAGARSAYRVHFDHFSGSPNGLALFDSQSSDGLILLTDRSESTWGDGIADAWRLRYFGSISAPASAAAGDADGDGVVNADEFANGTDPTDPLSY